MSEHETAPVRRPETGRPNVARPPLYRVLLLNDDFTPMDFVVEVLCVIFRRPADEAERITLEVHHRGRGICGVYPRDIAETKVQQVTDHSRAHGHPLRCVMEKAGSP